MDKLPSLTELTTLITTWFFTHIFTISSLVQISWLAGSVILAKILLRFVKSHTSEFFEQESRRRIKTLKRALESIIVPSFTFVLLQPYSFVAEAAALQSTIIGVAGNLIAAWIVIRFASAFIENAALARSLAVIVWTVAALNSLGIFQDIIGYLDAFGFMMGETRISPLTIIKGIITFGAMIWVANLIARFGERHVQQITQLTPSLRVLIVKIIRTLLIIFAVIIALNTLGIDLTSLAVFSGAIGVGIGFGLQKVVSNFVSGIILLIDRSIKPGDVIAIDQTYGWVNKLGARHVSVITRDGKEHLIPNELLITERVENWSYSDRNVRLKIPIGVAYHVDPRKALKLMLEAADETPRILKHPKPNALMIGFGDSSLDLELRAWINDPANGIRNITSELLLNVWDKFRENDIEIPFPQRDVHIKTGSVD